MVVAGRFAAPFVAEPVVLVVAEDVRTGSSTNFSLLISTMNVPLAYAEETCSMSITTQSALPDLSSTISLMAPSFSS